jgi:glucose/arabinose dehydrogenase
MRILISILILIPTLSTAQVDPNIWVRRGFKLSIALEHQAAARFMEFDDKGRLYVSFPSKGIIRTCIDKDGDGVYEKVVDYVKGHTRVQGMDWSNGWLWFAETGRIFKSRDTDGDGVCDEKIEVVKEGQIPSGGGHWWRPVLILNNRIYTAIGCSGNITDETDTERLKIWSFKLDGTDKQLYCGGLRNTEKLVNRPGTNEIWGMDHGSDWFGRVMEKKEDQGQPITDVNPPCEMNKYIKDGFYGHPYITGNRVPRYEYMDRPDITKWAKMTIPPAWPTGAHWAPNAMCFYDGNQFPRSMYGDAFVGYHGSWNRSEKGGYQVSRVLFENGMPYGELPIVKFLKDGEVLGRPVDVVVAPDGSLLISDDWGGKVYRLSYKP